VLERAYELVRVADDLDTLRAAQAVLLPKLGLTLAQTAAVLGRDKYWVSRARNRLLRGEGPLTRHGGRRHALVTEDQEVTLVKQAIEEVGNSPSSRVTLRGALRDLLDKQAGRAISESTITQLLDRTAPKIVVGANSTKLQQLAPALASKLKLEAYVAMVIGQGQS
jgi:hypothetical protein